MRGSVARLLRRVSVRWGVPTRPMKRVWNDSSHVERRITRRKLVRSLVGLMAFWFTLGNGAHAGPFKTRETCETYRAWLVYTQTTTCWWRSY